MFSIRLALVLALAPALVGASVFRKQSKLQAQAFRPMDCRRKHPAMMQKANLTGNSTKPGTGMYPAITKAQITDSPAVYMDGFSMAACIKDYMFYHGDKHGNNKFAYEIENASNVSITIYADLVPKEDQEAITPAVCFDFCRVQKDMLFFGIQNGRTCYCAPFVKPMAGSDDICDAPCEGADDMMCGSKEKSSVFEMHMCTDTAEQLATALTAFKDLTGSLKTMGTAMKASAETMITDSNGLQQKFGDAGDPTVGDLIQKATVAASDAQNVAKEALEFEAAQKALISSADAIKTADFAVFENANKADSIMVDIAQKKAIAEEHNTSLTDTALSFMPELFGEFSLNTTDSSKQYMPIMNFINRTYNETPATCGGELADLDMGLTKDGCASKCDSIQAAGKMKGCVGFLYIPGTPQPSMNGLPDSYCFMFSVFTSVQYYTGCKTAFLQTQKEHKGTMCYGKLTSFLGGAPPLDESKGQKATEADSRCVPEF